MTHLNLKGLILAGGLATRFGGGKCLARLKNRSLISLVKVAISPFCGEIWLSLRPGMKIRPFKEFFQDKLIVFDENPGAGPAGAIYSALKTGVGNTFLVVPCDQPFLKKALLQLLIKTFEEDPFLEALAFSDEKGRLLPFPGIYRKGLPSGSVRRIFKHCKSKIISAKRWRIYDPEGLSFFNINRREDLQKAAKLLEKYPELCRSNI